MICEASISGDTSRLASFSGRLTAMADAAPPITIRHTSIRGRDDAVVFAVSYVHGGDAISDGGAVFRQQ
jgi:hypothetical protein